MSAGFNKITLDIKSNLFEALVNATTFEVLAKGRIGNHLVKEMPEGIPIVRTTSKYNIPAQLFAPVHVAITDIINQTIQQHGFSLQYFNNALIEVYEASYAKMGYHSDQALDLADDSCIAVFSCYENPDTLTERNVRKLKVKDKITEEEFEYALTHNTVIIFSTETNKRFQHKIVLDEAIDGDTDNKWLGITLRTSKTLIQFKGTVTHFINGALLTLADKDQETVFYKLRGEENRGLDFVYPELCYTVNPADLMMPLKNNPAI